MELCLSAKILDSSPLAPYFLGQPTVLWNGWDNIVAALGRKVVLGWTAPRSVFTSLVP